MIRSFSCILNNLFGGGRNNRIALVGLRSVGKSYLANSLVEHKLVPEDTKVYELGQYVSEQVLQEKNPLGMAIVYLQGVNKFGIEEGRKRLAQEIAEKQNHFLDLYSRSNEPAIFALGGLIGNCPNWSKFEKTVNVVILDRPAAEIYKGVQNSHKKLLCEFEKQAPEMINRYFGCWDMDILFDDQMQPLNEKFAIEKIESMRQAMQDLYKNIRWLKTSNTTKPNEILQAVR